MKHVLISFLLFTTVIFPTRILSGQNSITTHTISDSAHEARSVSAADVDGDGYMDVISGHKKISWYDYDGSNSFIDHTVSTSGSKSVHAIDVNGDGYMDVVAAKRPGIRWHENDGSQRFTTHIITSNKKYGNFSYAVDLDQDGDTDVLSAGDDNITYHQNDGSESFTKLTIATARKSDFQSIYAADVDSDGDLDVLSAALSDSKISWYEINYPPVAKYAAITTSEDRDLIGRLPAFDSDGDGLTYSIIIGPANGRATVSDNAVDTFFYRPVEDYTGLDSLTFSVTDGVLSDSATVLITLTAVNDAPLAFVATVKTDEDIDYDGSVFASDIDNDLLTYSLLTDPSYGTVTITDSSSGTYTYSPKVNYSGSDSFTFTSSDGMLSDTSKVLITVPAVNDAPVAYDLVIGTYEDTEYSGSVSGFDVENDKLTYNILTHPSNGTVSIKNSTLGTFTYSPTINYNGDDSFTFTINDSNYSDTATVSITIIPWNNYGPDQLPAVQWGNLPAVLRKIMWVYYNLPNDGN